MSTGLRVMAALAVGIATGAAVWQDWRLLFPLLLLAVICLFMQHE